MSVVRSVELLMDAKPLIGILQKADAYCMLPLLVLILKMAGSVAILSFLSQQATALSTTKQLSHL